MSFVRFVFTVLIAGMAVNLAIVLMANSASHNRQLRQTQDQKRQLAEKLALADGRARRLDLLIESQHVRADDSVIDSTVVMRQYRSLGTDQGNPLPIQRLVIPGDKIQVAGMKLEFVASSAPEDQEYQFLRDKTLLYFTRVCGASQHAPDPPLPEERFTFTPLGQVPQLTVIDPAAFRPAYFESHLWQHLWDNIPNPPPAEPLPWTSRVTAAGLKVTWIKPVARTLRRGHVYTAYISTENVVTLEEDTLPSIPNLANVLLDEARKLPDTDPAR